MEGIVFYCSQLKLSYLHPAVCVQWRDYLGHVSVFLDRRPDEVSLL